MKRIILLSILALVLFGASVSYMSDTAISAEKPKGQAYSSSYSWDIIVDTAGNDSTFDTTGSVFLFTGIDDYSSVSGYFYIEVTAVDTGDAANDYADTTADSAAVLIYTDWGDTTYKRLVYKVSNLTPSTSATSATYFAIPADSILGDRLYYQICTAVGDTDYSVARAEAAVTYKITCNMRAKP